MDQPEQLDTKVDIANLWTSAQNLVLRSGSPHNYLRMVEHIIALKLGIGVDNVVSGGQTMNPSTEDILNAVEQVPASTVFVLPNNKNIIMAAEQVAALSTRKGIVLPTRTIPQGVTALIHYNPDLSVEENHLEMSRSLDTVDTAQVTFAARDSVVDGLKIKEGQMLGMENGAITVVEDSALTAA